MVEESSTTIIWYSQIPSLNQKGSIPSLHCPLERGATHTTPLGRWWVTVRSAAILCYIDPHKRGCSALMALFTTISCQHSWPQLRQIVSKIRYDTWTHKQLQNWNTKLVILGTASYGYLWLQKFCYSLLWFAMAPYDSLWLPMVN